MEPLSSRSERILDLLLACGSATIDQIAEAVGSSGPSVRRDLARLDRSGLIRRTHGGAKLVEPLFYEPFRRDASFQFLEARYQAEKRRIGLAAAGMVQDGEIIGLTAGETTTCIGRALRHRNEIQIVTNAVNIGLELSNRPNIRLSLTGGMLSSASAFSLTGTAPHQFMEDIYLDRVFIGVTGLDPERGATTQEMNEGLLYRRMQERSRQTIVVADSSKFGKVSVARICISSEIHFILTDTGASDAMVQPFIDRGCRVLRV